MCPVARAWLMPQSPALGRAASMRWRAAASKRRGRVHWEPVEAFPAPNAPAVAGVEDVDKDADAVASKATFMAGDSAYPDDGEANGGAGPGAAVAAEGPDAPRERAHRREGRPPRDTAPKPDAAVAGDKWSARNDADHVGNIGWLFGNWGKRPRNVVMRKSPGHGSEEEPRHDHRAG